MSVVSCWEVAKLVEKDRLKLSKQVGEWVSAALELPGVVLLPLTPEIDPVLADAAVACGTVLGRAHPQRGMR